MATLNRAWVLDRLMRNVEVSLGEKTIKLKVRERDKEAGTVEVKEIEVNDRDPAAANKALELLARHLGLFEQDNAQQGRATGDAAGQALIDRARRIAFLLHRAQTARVIDEPESAPETDVGGVHGPH
jgi:hypothetical protein